MVRRAIRRRLAVQSRQLHQDDRQAPASQIIPHGLGEVPKALILWTESRPNETFSRCSQHDRLPRRCERKRRVGIDVGDDQRPDWYASQRCDGRDDRLPAEHGHGDTARGLGADPASRRLVGLGQLARRSTDGWRPLPSQRTTRGRSSTTTGIAGGIASFSGATPTGIDGESGQSTASGFTHATPSITTTGTNELILATHEVASATTWTTPTGMTEAFDVSADAVPSCCGITTQVSYAIQAAAG